MNCYTRVMWGVLLLFMSTASYSNGEPNYHEELYNIYQSGKMDEWVEVLQAMQQEYKKAPNSQLLYDITLAQYGYIGFLLGTKDKTKAKEYLSRAQKNAAILEQNRENDANVLALKAALMAYQIAINPFKAPFIGPKSMDIIDESVRLNPNAPQALLEKANSAHYAPSMFGGDPQVAVQFYSKAINAFENENGGEAPRSWIYLNAYAQKALAFEKLEQMANAKRTYLHILSIAPDFKWVRDELYPRFLEKHK